MPGIFRRAASGMASGSRALFGLLRRRLPHLAVVALAVLVVLLSHQKRELRLEATSLRDRILKEVDFPHTGMVVPAFGAVTLDGDTVTVGHAAPETKQVLFIFDTRCGNCLVTLPTWNRVAGTLAPHGESVDVYGMSLDPEPDTRSYAKEHGLTFPVVLFEDERYRELYRVSGVPITLVVDAIGAVEYAFLGSIFGDAESAVVDSLLTVVVR